MIGCLFCPFFIAEAEKDKQYCCHIIIIIIIIIISHLYAGYLQLYT
jgi:t-SNARE complex subunit (syntaxin)